MVWFVIFSSYNGNFILDRLAFHGLSAPATLSEHVSTASPFNRVHLNQRDLCETTQDHSGNFTASCQSYWNTPISNAQPDGRPRLLPSEILNVNGVARDLVGKWFPTYCSPFSLLDQSFSFHSFCFSSFHTGAEDGSALVLLFFTHWLS